MSEKWHQLSLPNPEEADMGFALDANLHGHIIQTREAFRELGEKGGIEVTYPFVTAQKFVWQYVDYYPRRPEMWSEAARGYLMVEPDDIPLAIGLLDTIYQKRAQQGKPGQFKWLTRKLSASDYTNNDTRAWWHEVHNEEMVGSYKELYPTDPRVVIYEYSLDDIQEILSDLTTLGDWQIIENHRREAFSIEPPIRGDDHFIDGLGNSWYSLSFNRDVGHSTKKL